MAESCPISQPVAFIVVRTRFVVSTAIWDIGLLVAAMVLASLAVFAAPLPWQGPRAQLIGPLLAIMLVGAALVSVLTIGMSPPGVPRPSHGRGIAIVGGTFLLLVATLFFLRDIYFSRPFVGFTFSFWMIGATIQRIIRRRRPWSERIAVVGAEKILIDELTHADHADLTLVIDPQAEGEIGALPRNTTLAVDMRAVLSERVAQFVSSTDIAGYNVRPFTSIYEEHTGRIPLVHLAEGWEITTPLQTSIFMPGKRVFDLVAVIFTLPLWLPLVLVTALVVKLSSRGPAIFSQRRIGLHGMPFTLYKFRTMHTGAEDFGPKMATVDDERIVAAGGFLRRSRLDELPQIWNVVRGEMSLVGPRAEQIPFVRRFRRLIPFYDQRHLVRPGITGWAQVNYGYAESTADTVEKLAYDLYYVKRMSPVLDTQIMWKTISTVLKRRGR